MPRCSPRPPILHPSLVCVCASCRAVARQRRAYACGLARSITNVYPIYPRTGAAKQDAAFSNDWSAPITYTHTHSDRNERRGREGGRQGSNGRAEDEGRVCWTSGAD